MQEQISQQPNNTAAVSELWVRLDAPAALTLGSGAGTSEDKRYVYN